MKLNYKLSVTVISLILLFNFPGLTQEINTNNQGGNIQQKKYYFGLRRTSAPISYFDQRTSEWKGYCNALIQTLKASGFPIEIVELEINNRFTGKGSKGERLDAECGPNTITPERKEVIKRNGLEGQFSDTFAQTGAGALLLKDKMQLLTSKAGLNQLTFGIIKGTTTRGIVNNIYPSFDKNRIVNLDNNEDGMKKLRDGGIDVYFNDELILLNYLKTLNQAAGKEKYSIKQGLMSFEEYGVIVYYTDENQNRALLQKINDFIQQAGTQSFANTNLKILKNDFFQKFVEENELIFKNSLPPPPPPPPPKNVWEKIFPFLAASIITGVGGVGIFLQLKKNKPKKEPHKPDASVINKPSGKTEISRHTLPQFNLVNINNHQSNSNSKGNNMATNNFDQSHANINAGVQGTNEGSSTQQVIQNIYTSEQKQDLEKFAKDIPKILKKIEENNPNATQKEKQNIVSYEIPKEQRSRIVRALKAGGEEALKELLDNPYLNIAIAVVKEWQNEE